MKERGFTSWVKRPPALSSVSIGVHLWFFLLQLPDLGSRKSLRHRGGYWKCAFATRFQAILDAAEFQFCVLPHTVPPQ